MTTDNNKHVITNEIRELLFSYVTFSSSSETSSVLHISFSHAYTNLQNRRLSHEQFLISKNFTCLITLTIHIPGFQGSLQELQSSSSLHLHQHSP